MRIAVSRSAVLIARQPSRSYAAAEAVLREAAASARAAAE
jgi:hypothetical protein